MKIGFTGSREGMTSEQKTGVIALVIEHLASTENEAHHGDCIGADTDFHGIVRRYSGVKIISHPGYPTNTPQDISKRAFRDADEVRESKPFMPRNRDIVDECDFMLATPSTMKEQNYGGTWYTIKYARSKKKKLCIVYPDGSLGE